MASSKDTIFFSNNEISKNERSPIHYFQIKILFLHAAHVQNHMSLLNNIIKSRRKNILLIDQINYETNNNVW